MKDKLVIIVLLILLYLLSFGITAAGVWVICWAFKLAFSWRMVIGVYVMLTILKGMFGNGGKS